MRILNYILGIASVYISLWKNEMKYVWMNEADYVFAKKGSLVEVPCVEPSFWEVLMSIPWFQGLMEYEWMIWTTLCVTWIMICAMCVLLCVVCKMLSMMIHATLIEWLSLSKFWTFTHFPNRNFERSLSFLFTIWQVPDLTFNNHVVRKELFLLMHVLRVWLDVIIISTSVY